MNVSYFVGTMNFNSWISLQQSLEAELLAFVPNQGVIDFIPYEMKFLNVNFCLFLIRFLSGWLLPTEPFTPTMWTAEIISFISIFVAMIIIRIVMKKLKSVREIDITTTCLQIYAMFLLQCTKLRYV